MRWVKAVVLAFSTYTRFPVPQIKWDDDAIKLSIAFLPIIGAVIGCFIWGWQYLCAAANFSPVFFAAVAAAVPVLITGGIHMDGFCDTCDALASWQSSERRLEIMKDPHIGAFALIRYVIYILIYFALLYELQIRGISAGIAFLYPLPRLFAAWSAMLLPNARKGGMLAAFTENADRRKVCAVLAVFTFIAVFCWVWFTLPYGIAALALTLPVAFWYRHTALKYFGGVTGDTTGFYLQICELTLLAGLLLGEAVTVWL
ncbi:MAG: adenosylcobinamide-GDP ribazoletransferase [Clostridiales bacterium]|jgi:adenosylcobinamide-GDP ribazoletransferase|nr:adenosylcobinamide-GDP ribazoletransferase [Clostridiales bacterium]